MVLLNVYRGAIPVVAYHDVGGGPEFAGGPRYDIHGLNVAVSTFRGQLEQMYAEGFWPLNMRDVIEKRLDLPVGKRAIVLTFDDGRATQFRYLADGSIDPNCAVGVMVAFHHVHPDWPMRGSFYLIAGLDQNGAPFDQEGTEERKVRQLLKWGFEIGNHTLTHANFHELNRRQIVREVSGGDAYLKKLIPGIEVDTLALPYGELPKHARDFGVLRHSAGHRYRNMGVLLFNDKICPSPFSASFDPFMIPRFAPEPGRLEAVLKEISAKG